MVGNSKKFFIALAALLIGVAITVAVTIRAGWFYSKRIGLKDLEITKQGISLKEIQLSEDDPHKSFRWTLHAKEVNVNKENTILEFKDYLLQLVSEKHGQLDLRGPKGNYLRDQRLFRLTGEISLESLEGYMVKGKDVVFEEGKGLISSEQGITLLGKDISLYANRFLFDLDTGHLKMERQVKATFKVTKT